MKTEYSIPRTKIKRQPPDVLLKVGNVLGSRQDHSLPEHLQLDQASVCRRMYKGCSFKLTQPCPNKAIVVSSPCQVCC